VSGANKKTVKLNVSMLNKYRYTEGFGVWMKVLNYNAHSIKTYPVVIERLFDYLIEQGVRSLEEITGEHIKTYFEYLSQKPVKISGQPCTLGTLRTYLTAVRLFARFIRQTEEQQIDVPVQYFGKSDYKHVVFTTEEIEALYAATEDGLLGMRDRAMLAIYYGCGARRNEGQNIKVKDILPDRNLVYISKGKNYKERYIPMVGKVKENIIEYLTVARPLLLNKEGHDYFFVGSTGAILQNPAIYERFQTLLKKAGIEKKAGLHALRHSIATHLLHQGMKLTDIARFLGHTTLESTQIYTHIEAQISKQENKKI
jgi:site-specific recombinase XerD